jgi:hypothetical protein
MMAHALLPVDHIKVDERMRKDLGDIAGLAAHGDDAPREARP